MVTASKIFEDSLYRDEVLLNNLNRVNQSAKYQDYSHEYTRHRKETFHLIAEIKDLVADYNITLGESSSKRILIVDSKEINDLNRSALVKYYGSSQINGFDWIATTLDKSCSAELIKWSVDASSSHKKAPFWMVSI